MIPVAFIYDYWSHLFSVAQNISLVEILWLLKNYLLLFIFPYSKWTRCWLTSIFDGSWMLCLWKDISEEICFLKGQKTISHSVKVQPGHSKENKCYPNRTRLVLVAGELSKDEYRSGDRSGTSGNTWGHSLQKRTWSLSDFVSRHGNHTVKSTRDVTSKDD